MNTSPDHPRYAPSLFLSALQAMNIFSLSLLLLPRAALAIGGWFFAIIFLALCSLFNWRNSKIINDFNEKLKFSKLSDNVPGIREFPYVYGYLALTLFLLFLPAFTV